MDFTIRTMLKEELPIAVGWAAEEGWNPGLHDAETYYAADPNGYFIGYLGEEPIATISAVRYGATYGFVGLFIVKPEYRGKTYGLEIGRVAMAYLEGRNIGTDGVLAKQKNYQTYGFRTAYLNHRYEGTGGGAMPDGDSITKLSDLSFEQVAAYDQPFCPEARPAFLKAWIGQPDAHALGVLRDGQLAGYGVMRACRKGHKIGPLYADTPQLAELLFGALRSKAAPSEPVYLDISEVTREAVALVERHRMELVFQTARMYTGPVPDLPLDRLYGITSFEIG